MSIHPNPEVFVSELHAEAMRDRTEMERMIALQYLIDQPRAQPQSAAIMADMLWNHLHLDMHAIGLGKWDENASYPLCDVNISHGTIKVQLLAGVNGEGRAYFGNVGNNERIMQAEDKLATVKKAA